MTRLADNPPLRPATIVVEEEDQRVEGGGYRAASTRSRRRHFRWKHRGRHALTLADGVVGLSRPGMLGREVQAREYGRIEKVRRVRYVDHERGTVHHELLLLAQGPNLVLRGSEEELLYLGFEIAREVGVPFEISLEEGEVGRWLRAPAPAPPGDPPVDLDYQTASAGWEHVHGLAGPMNLGMFGMLAGLAFSAGLLAAARPEIVAVLGFFLVVLFPILALTAGRSASFRVRMDEESLRVERGWLRKRRRRVRFDAIRSVRVLSPRRLGVVREDGSLEVILDDADIYELGPVALALRDLAGVPLEDCTGLLEKHELPKVRVEIPKLAHLPSNADLRSDAMTADPVQAVVERDSTPDASEA